MIHGGPSVGLPRGKNFTGFMHHADWIPTFLAAAAATTSGSITRASEDADVGAVDIMSGLSIWSALCDRNSSNLGPRNSVVLNVDPTNQVDANDAGGWSGYAGIVAGDWKLLLGWGGIPDSWCWPNQINATMTDDDAIINTAEVSVTGAHARVQMQRVAFPPPNEGAQTCNAPPGTQGKSIGICCAANDIKIVDNSASSAECCASCYAEPACAGFTWHLATKKCWLKTSVAVCSACGSDATSGAVPGRTPAPAPSPSPSPTPPYPGALQCGYSGAVPPLPLRTKPMLFNLRHDPGERIDRSATELAILKEMMVKLQPFLDAAVWPLNAYGCKTKDTTGCRGTDPLATAAAKAANAWVMWNGTSRSA